MLDNKHAITDVAQRLHRRDEFLLVAGMQPDARFIEDIGNTGESAAELAGEPNSADFAARERRSRSGQF